MVALDWSLKTKLKKWFQGDNVIVIKSAVDLFFWWDLIIGFKEHFWLLRIDYWILIKISKLTINDLFIILSLRTLEKHLL